MSRILKVLLFVLAATLFVSVLFSTLYAKTAFSDIKPGAYYEESVSWAVDNLITNGTSSDKFSPDMNCTRGHIVTFLYRALGEPAVIDGENPFTDVDEYDYFYNAVLWAVKNGITNGTSPTTFSPDATATREQVVTFLYNVAKKPEVEEIDTFKDVKKDRFYTKPISWAVKNKVTNGMSKTEFGIGITCTRCQTVTFMYNYFASVNNPTPVSLTYPVESYNSLKINGKDISSYKIIYDNDGGIMQYAADELQKYIKKTCDVELGKTSDTSKKEETIYIKNTLVNSHKDAYHYFSNENGIVIEGSSQRGALYGVYNFLEEQLGWRFFTDGCEICLLIGDTNLENLDETYTPYFDIRDTYWDAYTRPGIAVKRMQNGQPIPEELGGFESFTCSGPHTIGVLSETGGGLDPNPCFNDEEIYQTTLKNVRALIEQYPDTKRLPVTQNDTGSRCQCEKCLADDEYYGSPAGSVIKFVNRIARDIKEDYPDVLIVTFAYGYTQTCPVNIVCEDNVMIELCPISCCYNHTIDDPTCARNAELMKDYEGWTKICKQMYIWDYTANFYYYCMPFPNFDVIRENIQLFKRNNAIGVLEQGNYQQDSSEFGELRSYLISKALENPYMSDEEYELCMDEFLMGYYGPGWRYIKSYIQFCHDLSNKLDFDFRVFSTPEETYGKRGFAPYADQIKSWWDNALSLAQNEEQRLRIRRSRISADFIRIGSIFKAENKAGGERREIILKECENLFNEMWEFKVYLMGEVVFLPREVDLTINPRMWVERYNYRE